MIDARHVQIVHDALASLRRNGTRSILSGLGITIGVASLSAVLAIGDGMEVFARAQILEKTSVHDVVLTPRRVVHHAGRSVTLREERRFALDPQDLEELSSTLLGLRSATLVQVASGEVDLADSTRLPVRLVGVLPGGLQSGGAHILRGRDLTAEDLRSRRHVAVVSADLESRLLPAPEGIGRLLLEHTSFDVVGVTEHDETTEMVAIALPSLPEFDLDPSTRVLATAIFSAERIEDVDGILEGIERWLGSHHPDWREGAELAAQRAHLVELERGILLMKGLMAAITGIALVVGGIGIMNVLLMSVTERTREIGIRRALGARSTDIRRQLLVESMLLCAIGAVLGAAIGVGGAHAIAWILRETTDAQIHAAVTAGSLVFAVGSSVVVGLAFGTYPARRAARLSPVEAIRHE
jgi:putative ABC transport system permease protein